MAQQKLDQELLNIRNEAHSLEIELEEKVTDESVNMAKNQIIIQMQIFDIFHKEYNNCTGLDAKKALICAMELFMNKAQQQYEAQKDEINRMYVKLMNQIRAQAQDLMIQAQRYRGVYSSNSQPYELRSQSDINTVTFN